MVQTKFDTRSQATVAVTTGLLVLYIFMAIIGNSFVCLALYRNRRLRTVTNLYPANTALAVGEIFMASVVFPFSVIASILREWPFNYNFVQFHGFITYFWAGVSIYTLVLTAMNRYFCLVRPQRHHFLFTKEKAIKSIVFVVIFTLTSGLPSAIYHPCYLRLGPKQIILLVQFEY